MADAGAGKQKVPLTAPKSQPNVKAAAVAGGGEGPRRGSNESGTNNTNNTNGSSSNAGKPRPKQQRRRPSGNTPNQSKAAVPSPNESQTSSSTPTSAPAPAVPQQATKAPPVATSTSVRDPPPPPPSTDRKNPRLRGNKAKPPAPPAQKPLKTPAPVSEFVEVVSERIAGLQAETLLVQIPEILVDWAVEGEQKCTEVLLAVKEQANAYAISIRVMEQENTAQKVKKSVVVHAPTPDSARIAKILLETHFKNQADLIRLDQKAQARQQDFNKYQIEVSKGLRVIFNIDKTYIGMAIGKNGTHIKEVQEKTGCDINISHDGCVSVAGPTASAVQAAKQAMTFEQKAVEIPVSVIFALDNERKRLQDIREQSGCASVTMERGANVVMLLGTNVGVTTAETLLHVNFDYIQKQMECREKEKLLRNRLADLQGVPDRQQYYDRRQDHDQQRSGQERQERSSYRGNRGGGGGSTNVQFYTRQAPDSASGYVAPSYNHEPRSPPPQKASSTQSPADNEKYNQSQAGQRSAQGYGGNNQRDRGDRDAYQNQGPGQTDRDRDRDRRSRPYTQQTSSQQTQPQEPLKAPPVVAAAAAPASHNSNDNDEEEGVPAYSDRRRGNNNRRRGGRGPGGRGGA